MASTHSDDEVTEDKSKSDDTAVDSSAAAAKDIRNSESQEKRPENATAENTSNLQAPAATEEKDASEKTVESEPQVKENHSNVELKEKAVDPSTDGKNISKTVWNNKVKRQFS